MITTFVLCALLAQDGTPPLPGTEEAEDAKAKAAVLLNEGNALFEKSQFRPALQKYESAYRVYPSPKILFNIAEAHNALGHPYEAATYYDRFVKEAKVEPGSAIAVKVDEKRKALDPSLAYLEIEGEPTAAEVFVDGNVAGTLPMAPIYVAPGSHEVSASMPGYSDQKLTVEAKSGERTPVVLKLPAAIVAQKDGDAPAAKEAIVATTTPGAGASADEPLTSKWWFWTALGGAVAAGVVVAVVAGSGGTEYTPSGELPPTKLSEWGN